MDRCCCSLHWLDVQEWSRDPSAAAWVPLPLPPVTTGHVRPDVSFVVRGTRLYLVGGTVAFDTMCCWSCEERHSGGNRVLDLLDDKPAWRPVADTDPSSFMRIFPLRSGSEVLIGGFGTDLALVGQVQVGANVLRNVEFRRAKFAAVRVEPAVS